MIFPSIGYNLTPPLRRAAWIAILALGIFGGMVVLDRSLARCGVDFIVYYEPDSVPAERRLPLESRGRPEFAIRTVSTAAEFEFRNPPVLMFHVDAADALDLPHLRSEYARGTVIIGVDATAERMAALIEPTIADVAVGPPATGPPFYTLVVKNEDQCNDGLRAGCGAFVVETAPFVDYDTLTAHARDALAERFRPFILTPTPTATP